MKIEEIQKETQEAQKAQEKVYCKDCKFRPRIFRTGYCVPSFHVGTRLDDWFSSNHWVRKLNYGTFEMKAQNKNNDCPFHQRSKKCKKLN